MAHLLLKVCAAAAVSTAVGGCATAPDLLPPEVPAALRPTSGQQLFLEALASGVQIYECAPKPDQPDQYAWLFRAPEATLTDRAGRPLGKHYAGPTWESTDGSLVMGDVKARDPGPRSDAIPWLLLRARSVAGAGNFGKTVSIQRVATVGGAAPSEPCAIGRMKKLARVPYTATYYFYSAAP